MAASDPLEILLAHDKWATRQILLACEKLPADQFTRKFEMGRGSLQATITHMIAAMRTWNDTLAERTPRPRIDDNGVAYSSAELSELYEEAANELSLLAKQHPVDGVVKRSLRGRDYSFTRGAIVTHVTTHDMHHRAQCLNMLRHAGVNPLPLSSVAEWTWAADGQ